MVFGILLAVAGGAIGSFVTDKLISGGTDNIEIEIIADDNSYKINVNPNNPSAITFSTDSDITNKSAIMKIKNGDVCDTTNITLYTTVVDPIFREGKVSYVHRPLLNEKYDSFHTFLYVCYTYFHQCARNIEDKAKYATQDKLNEDTSSIINSYLMSDPKPKNESGFNYHYLWQLTKNVFPLLNGNVQIKGLSSMGNYTVLIFNGGGRKYTLFTFSDGRKLFGVDGFMKEAKNMKDIMDITEESLK
jgi:hypothetical protein